MPNNLIPKLQALPHEAVRITGGFWLAPTETNRTVTLPYQYERCRDTGRIDSLRLAWKPGKEPTPHHFWDSDIAKWIEAAGYSLATHPDRQLEALVDGVIDMIDAAQEDDGYFNSYFQQVCPEKRWTNLRDMHELYCAGHLMEAAVAYRDGTGKTKLLEVMERYAHHIAGTFGDEPDKLHGYPGHEEIELALVKMFRATGDREYLDLARYFVDERGARRNAEPGAKREINSHYFTIEAQRRGDDQPLRWKSIAGAGWVHDYWQAHLPVREQESAEGHSVRACYLYAGMADVARETGNQSLLEACRRLWRNITEKRMYVTGGIGSHKDGERFTLDFDLPNEGAYSETCAAIALVFFAKRMLDIEADSRYADVMELALYNTVLGGVSMDGTRFFYANPLAVNYSSVRLPHVRADLERQEWYDCACCPPNIARLLASLGGYVASRAKTGLYMHLYLDCSITTTIGKVEIRCDVQTRYPWDETVRISVSPDSPVRFEFGLRIPAWCTDPESLDPEVSVNGRKVDHTGCMRSGYVVIDREWRTGDTVELRLPMDPRRVYSRPEVRDNAGRVAFMRGPLVYCLEEVDNGTNLHAATIPAEADVRVTRYDVSPADWMILEAEGVSFDSSGSESSGPESGRSPGLYSGAPLKGRTTRFRMIPYAFRANRTCGEMVVWVRE